MGKDPSNICRKAILEEVSNGIHGLAYECTQICRELELPDIMGTFANKNRIKSSIFLKINEKSLEDMRERCISFGDAIENNSPITITYYVT